MPAVWERPLKKWSLRRASAVVCVSQYTRARTLAFDHKLEKVHVIPNGGDSGQFKVLSKQETEAFREKLGLNASQLLLTVGHVSERKGQDIVIRALPYVLREMPYTQYVMVGLPTKQADFAKLARQLGVQEHVHFFGEVDPHSLVLFYNCCDVFVMTSRYAANQFEGYGIAVVEAALCGKPAIVSTGSGLAEAIAAGSTGYGVPIDDEVKTAEAILMLLKDEPRRLQMSAAARKRALEEQTWEGRIKHYHELFTGLVLESSHSRECN
jgi:phosphatidylinositol alpha-1,6-mannosyltransferase